MSSMLPTTTSRRRARILGSMAAAVDSGASGASDTAAPYRTGVAPPGLAAGSGVAS